MSQPRVSKETSNALLSEPAALEQQVEALDGLSPPVPSNEILPRQMRTWQWILLSSGILFANVLVNLDSTVVADLQPQILAALQEVSKFPWINPTYSLGNVGSSLMWGKLYGLFDHRTLFISAFVLFEAGSTLSGAAPNMDAHIIGRVITGIGGSGLYLGTMNILSNLTSLRERPLYVSYMGVTWGIGTVLGPIIGGLLSQSSAGWRWSFYLNLVAGGITLPIYVFLLPAYRPQKISLSRAAKQIDFLGYVLWAGALVSLLMVLSFGGALYAWGSARMIALCCTSTALWTAFIAQQVTGKLMPRNCNIFPVQIAKSLEIWLFAIQTAISIGVLFVSINYLPLYFQFVRAESALQSGKDLLPLIFFGVAAFLLNGTLMRSSYYIVWYILGSLLSVAGAALMVITRVNTVHAIVYVASSMLGLGSGLYVLTSYAVVQAKTPQARITEATTLVGCTQVGSQAISLALANCIFFNRAAAGIRRVLPDVPTGAIQTGIAGARASLLAGLSDSERSQVVEAVQVAIRNVWIHVLTISVLSVVLTFAMKRERMPTQS